MPPKIESSSTSNNPNAALHDQLQVLIHLSTATNHRLDNITAHLVTQSDNMTNLFRLLTTDNFNRPPPPPPPPLPPPPPPPPNTHPRPPKIYLPNFDGSNPLDWVFQAENYFTYYVIPPNQRLALSVFYFTGDALSWYKHMSNNNLLGTWAEFTRTLETRFRPFTYEKQQATLFKLHQISTVVAYQSEFEKISNCVVGLPPIALRDCFISGLL